MHLALADPIRSRRLLAAGERSVDAWTTVLGARGTPRRRASDERPVLAAAFEATRAAVHVFTEDGIICQTNPAFDRMFGIGRGQYLGKHVAVLNVASVSANRGLLQQMRAIAAGGGTWRGQVENRRRDGTRFRADLQVQALEIAGARYLVGTQEERVPGI